MSFANLEIVARRAEAIAKRTQEDAAAVINGMQRVREMAGRIAILRSAVEALPQGEEQNSVMAELVDEIDKLVELLNEIKAINAGWSEIDTIARERIVEAEPVIDAAISELEALK